MKFNKKVLLRFLTIFLFLILAAKLLLMQFGLANHGQECGTYGQYNRVVRLLKESEKYTVLNHGLSRDLDLKNLGHLNRFHIKLRNPKNEEFTIEFLEGTEAMKEKDETILKNIIEGKIRKHSDSLP